MNSRTLIIAVVAAVIGAVIGVSGYIWFVGGDGTPSGTTTAPTLDVNALATLNPTQAWNLQTQVAELNATGADLETTIEALNIQIEALQAVTEEPVITEEAVATEEPVVTEEVMATEEPVVTEEAVATEEPVVTEEAVATEEPVVTEEVMATEEPVVTEEVAAQRILYRIDSEASDVQFFLQEDLRGQRTDVIGVTNQVAGDIIIDLGSPSLSQIGTIRINARTLETDQSFRNRALRSQILRSSQDEYEYIDFTPTALNGLPDAIAIGETYSFEIVGDLLIIGNSNEVTFAVEATLTDDNTLTGTASATVLYADWGITIPSVPGVANITDDVTLTISFTANQVEQ